MEDITDADYPKGKIVVKDIEIKNLREYHDLYFQSNTILKAVFENLRNMCLNYMSKFLSAPGKQLWKRLK